LLLARTSAAAFCTISSESARQVVSLTKGYFLAKPSWIGRMAWFWISAA
jgi:hypothetical protein